jgi:hypothetical protein
METKKEEEDNMTTDRLKISYKALEPNKIQVIIIMNESTTLYAILTREEAREFCLRTIKEHGELEIVKEEDGYEHRR